MVFEKENKTKSFMVKFTEKDLAAARYKAAMYGTTLSNFMREAVKHWKPTKKKRSIEKKGA